MKLSQHHLLGIIPKSMAKCKHQDSIEVSFGYRNNRWCPDCGSLKYDESYINSSRKFYPPKDSHWDALRPSREKE